MLLNITHDEVETCKHGIIHLEHHVEVQDAELEVRAEMIANLEQQLLELQVQAPLEPANPEEIDAMLEVDKDWVSSMLDARRQNFERIGLG